MASRTRGGGKLPGKTTYSGRRRNTTRRSGFKSHPDATGGQCRTEHVPRISLETGESIVLTVDIQASDPGWLGYGGWFQYQGDVSVQVEGGPDERTLTEYGPGVWNKVGCLWEEDGPVDVQVQVKFIANSPSWLALYEFDAGTVTHDALEILCAARAVLEQRLDSGITDSGEVPVELTRAERFLADDADSIAASATLAKKALARIGRLLSKNHTIAPEACFYQGDGSVVLNGPTEGDSAAEILLKTCNRCGRYLPVNAPPGERAHLSFSNHCSADHKRPCQHTGFGRLTDEEGETLQLDYGFQLECRFCKKYFVNAALNPQRTAAQMKEDGTRRRAFEALLADLYQGSPQLRYRQVNKRELTDDVWNRFGGHCFNCNVKLKTRRSMNLDHTRPLKLLWPLDGFATALCKSCNSQKRDRPPVEFYTDHQLRELAEITGCPEEDLTDPAPNVEALTELLSNLDWFFGSFLTRPEMTKERDGKVAGELVVRALQKVVEAAPDLGFPDLVDEYDRRRVRSQLPLAAERDDDW